MEGSASPDSGNESSPPPATAMRGLPVLFTALAEEDLDQIEDYISAHDPAAAARVRAAIVQQSLQLGSTPEKATALKESRSKQEIGVRLWPVSC
jgi:plasmid stabilization system protein ParE